jgi:uncharacterized membrane protein
MLMTTKTQQTFGTGAILLFAAGLRIFSLGKQSLFLDEAWSWAASRLSFFEMLRLSVSEPHPPLYYLLLKFTLIVLPSSEAGLRLLSTLLSIGSLAVVLVYVGSRWNVETMLYVGVLMSLKPFDIYYAQEARIYILLGFLLVCSYVSLLLALEGRRMYLFLWPLTTILMVWTHAYGILFAGTSILCLSGYLFLVHLRKLEPQHSLDSRMLIGGTMCIVLGILPFLANLLTQSLQGVGGTWLATPKDILVLFLLWASGFAPVREYFLDSTHLVLPAMADISMLTWAAIGMAISGFPVAWGMYRTWRKKSRYRLDVLLALMLILLPVALVFIWGTLTKQRIWAFKSFLGTAYLFYLWAGIGIGSLMFPWFRRGLGLAIVIVAVMSLWPYFTVWQKSNAASAFQALPELSSQDGLIIKPSYIEPLVFYYLDQIVPAYAILTENGKQKFVFQILHSDQQILGPRQEIPCKELSALSNFLCV